MNDKNGRKMNKLTILTMKEIQTKKNKNKSGEGQIGKK